MGAKPESWTGVKVRADVDDASVLPQVRVQQLGKERELRG